MLQRQRVDAGREGGLGVGRQAAGDAPSPPGSTASEVAGATVVAPFERWEDHVVTLPVGMSGPVVVRIGDTVRRPRGAGSDVVEAVLIHLETVGWDLAPRHLGTDELGRQTLAWIDGEVHRQPPWQLDHEANAARRARDL